MSNTHRDLCKYTTAWLLKQSWCDIACFEIKYYRGYVDALGISSPRSKTHRVTAVEVKRTRSDLLQDIRKKKYRKYEAGSTHCYLAATANALMLKNRSVRQVLNELRDKEVPDYWGVLLIGPRGGITCLRPARKHRKTTLTRIRSLTRKIAKSLCYRALQGKL